MKLPKFIVNSLLVSAINTINSRDPDFIIMPDGRTPYLKRWWKIPRNKFFNNYIHIFLRSDEDRALHDHPWLFNVSILLKGEYTEERIKAGGIHTKKVYKAGNVIFRGPWSAHRVELNNDSKAVTMFLTGPIIREWGFHCTQGWRSWKIFTNPLDSGKIGRGCD